MDAIQEGAPWNSEQHRMNQLGRIIYSEKTKEDPLIRIIGNRVVCYTLSGLSGFVFILILIGFISFLLTSFNSSLLLILLSPIIVSGFLTIFFLWIGIHLGFLEVYESGIILPITNRFEIYDHSVTIFFKDIDKIHFERIGLTPRLIIKQKNNEILHVNANFIRNIKRLKEELQKKNINSSDANES